MSSRANMALSERMPLARFMSETCSSGAARRQRSWAPPQLAAADQAACLRRCHSALLPSCRHAGPGGGQVQQTAQHTNHPHRDVVLDCQPRQRVQLRHLQAKRCGAPAAEPERAVGQQRTADSSRTRCRMKPPAACVVGAASGNEFAAEEVDGSHGSHGSSSGMETSAARAIAALPAAGAPCASHAGNPLPPAPVEIGLLLPRQLQPPASVGLRLAAGGGTGGVCCLCDRRGLMLTALSRQWRKCRAAPWLCCVLRSTAAQLTAAKLGRPSAFTTTTNRHQ